MPSETEWTRKVCKQMEQAGALIYPLVGNVRQQAGLPDRLVICRGHTYFIEFKGEKTRITALQAAIHSAILKHGGKVFVARWPGILQDGTTFSTGQELVEVINRKLSLG